MRSSTKFLLSCLAVLGLSTTYAQSDKTRVRVKISTDNEADARMRPYSIVRSSPNAIMMFRNGEFDVRAFGKLSARLDLYDRTKLTFIRSQEPATKLGNGAKILLEDLVYFAGRPILIARGTGDETALYYQAQEPNLTRLPRPFEKLCTWDMKVKDRRPLVVSGGSALREPFNVRVSRDTTHMLVHSPEIRSEEGQAVVLLAMIGSDMGVLWQHVVPVAETTRLTEILDVELDNSGSAYILVKNNFSKKDVKEDVANFEIKLFKASAEGVVESVFNLGSDVFPSSAMLQMLENGRIACAGVYSSTADNRLRTIGNFMTTFEAGSTEMGEPVMLPFNDKTTLGAEGEPEEDPATKFEQKDKKKMALSTDLIALLPRSDGGYFMVNELYYSYTYYNTTLKRMVTMYVHGPVQSRCIDKAGNETWSTDFRRWTASESKILGRVFCAEYNDQLFLFLLDSEEMAERRKAGEKIKPNHIKGPYSAYVAFDENGGFKIKSILKSDKEEDFISGWELVRTGKDEYIALGTEKLMSGRFLPVRIEFSTESK